MEKSYPENANVCKMNKMETLSVILRYILSLQSYTEYLLIYRISIICSTSI